MWTNVLFLIRVLINDLNDHVFREALHPNLDVAGGQRGPYEGQFWCFPDGKLLFERLCVIAIE